MIEKKFLVPLWFCAVLITEVSFSETRVNSWITTTSEKPWRVNSVGLIRTGSQGASDLEIDASESYQIIDGFGGAFNEKGWAALSVLSENERQNVLKEIFDPEDGLKFNICRVPIGASDYAMDRYTLDESSNDYVMSNFSIERDKKMLIPYIKAAMKYRPDLQLWGSAWTPPTWMKDSGAFDGGDMKDKPEIYRSYALYLARFIEAYRAEGLNMTAVCEQNEPLIMTHYPSCLWMPGQFLDFIKNYMGPLFQKRGLTNAIWLGTLQDGNYKLFPETVLKDPEANRYISAVALQWGGINSVAKIRENFPDKKIVQSETECGNWSWKSGYNPDMPQNDWAYGSYTWRKIRGFISLGANSYMLWNMILDQEGKNIDELKPWPQDAAVVINSINHSVTYTPMFYATKHFSYFVRPGSKVIKTSGSWDESIAFQNQDGSVILEILNDSDKARDFQIKIGNSMFKTVIPGKSFDTFTINL